MKSSSKGTNCHISQLAPGIYISLQHTIAMPSHMKNVIVTLALTQTWGQQNTPEEGCFFSRVGRNMGSEVDQSSESTSAFSEASPLDHCVSLVMSLPLQTFVLTFFIHKMGLKEHLA